MLVNSDVVGHLLSIGTNQVVPVLLGVVSGADSLCRDANVEAIYPDPVAGEDVLHIIRAILAEVGWQFF